MSILQRLLDALAPPPPAANDPLLPPPDGAIRMRRALTELEASSAELRRTLDRPDIAETLRQARDQARGPAAPGSPR